jgi:hypothetical protein
MDVEALIKLRNGDWAIFIEEYHRSISHASKILWVIEEAMLPGFLSNEELMEKIVSSVLSDMTIHDFDVENYAAVIDSIFAIAMIKTPFGPFVRVLKSRINKAIHIFRSIMSRQKQSTESFFRKFERAMNKTYFIG